MQNTILVLRNYISTNLTNFIRIIFMFFVWKLEILFGIGNAEFIKISSSLGNSKSMTSLVAMLIITGVTLRDRTIINASMKE